MVGDSYQNVFLIYIDALSFAEFEISEFQISRVNCIKIDIIHNDADDIPRLPFCIPAYNG